MLLCLQASSPITAFTITCFIIPQPCLRHITSLSITAIITIVTCRFDLQPASLVAMPPLTTATEVVALHTGRLGFPAKRLTGVPGQKADMADKRGTIPVSCFAVSGFSYKIFKISALTCIHDSILELAFRQRAKEAKLSGRRGPALILERIPLSGRQLTTAFCIRPGCAPAVSGTSACRMSPITGWPAARRCSSHNRRGAFGRSLQVFLIRKSCACNMSILYPKVPSTQIRSTWPKPH